MRIHISSFRQILNDTIILQNKYNFHVIYCNDYRIYLFFLLILKEFIWYWPLKDLVCSKTKETILNKYFDLKKKFNQEIYTIVQNNVWIRNQ